MWTQHLSTNNYILPTDFSPEMLKIMEKRTGVRGELLDNYNLQLKRPEQYDMCFFAFWLSHVPDSFVTDFIGSILRTFKSGTRLLVFDSYLNNTELNCLEHKGNIQIRALKSGDVYRVYKKYFTRDELEDLASACCTSHRIEFTQNYFYILDGNL
jgi:demethylmenaquinone methyltransferase/2-methoxy-6-polyprenyl-1,4-benzoquinol methylase